jgi:protein-tyrosine-phosphatase
MTGPQRSPKPIRALFVCTGNAGRSQMAEALLRSQGGDAFEPYSAGTHPTVVHPLTIRALDEIAVRMAEFIPVAPAGRSAVA